MSFECVEPRYCLSAIAFSSHNIQCCAVSGASDVYAADLDGDGDTDVLSASRYDHKIASYENDGQGNFGEQQIITTQAHETSDVHAADLDGDGDMDVLSASYRDDKIAWYENTDGLGNFGEQQIITTLGATYVYAADLDGDGDVDVLSASYRGNKIAWYENTDGKGTFGPQQIITPQASNPRSVHAADLDGDGDMDVLSASEYDNKIAWYENTDGQGTFGDQQVISNQFRGAFSVHAADIDQDGDVDVFSAEDNSIVWYENTDGQGTFGPQQVITTEANGANSIHVADLDGDGDLDVLSASHRDDKIAWYENTDGLGNFGEQQIITTLGATAVYAADLDGDGDVDVLSTSSRHGIITWYENTDGQGTFGDQQVITTQASGARDVHSADVDGDGDLDVLSASRSNGRIVWYENTDGQGNFGDQQDITTEAREATSVHAADIDGDGDLDVLSTSFVPWSPYNGSKIIWYENTDGKGTFGPQQIITPQATNPRSVYAADLDGDGDLDVLSASYQDSQIAWYENTDGQGTFGDQQVITTDAWAAGSAYAADLDGDGDLDVLSAISFLYDRKIVWYENTDGQGTFGPQQVITTEASDAVSVYAADLDGDGDLDVFSASQVDDKIPWYENTDGQGAFGQQQVITTKTDGPRSVCAADLDGDGDVDVLSASRWDGRIAWHENRLIGDVNDDGVFNSSDLVQVFQAGEYEDRISDNSNYDEGDWNGDGEFDSSDLVMAFQAGVYERPAVESEFAAAVDWLFARDQRTTHQRVYVA